MRVKCIELFGAVACPDGQSDAVLLALARFSNDVDSRVRTAVFKALVSSSQRILAYVICYYATACFYTYQRQKTGVRLY